MGCPGGPLGLPWGLRECLRELPGSSRGAPWELQWPKKGTDWLRPANKPASRGYGESIYMIYQLILLLG